MRFNSLATLLLAFAPSLTVAEPATSPGMGQVGTIAFDVISVKPDHSGATRESMGMNRDGFTANNVQLHDFLLQVFGLQQENQLVGEPKWTSNDRWDIDARVAQEDIPALAKLTYRERMGMFQVILNERFGMKMHHETRRLPAYELVVAKGGPKMTPSKRRPEDPNSIPGDPGVLRATRGKETGIGTTMEFLAEDLSDELGRKVVDHTGLAGRYDFTLTWTPDSGAAAGAALAASSEAECPSLFTAVREQLGLRLEPVKAPVDVVVIDRLEKPAEN